MKTRQTKTRKGKKRIRSCLFPEGGERNMPELDFTDAINDLASFN